MAPEEKVAGAKIGLISALKLLQERLGETQEGMAARLGCTFSAYSKWLRGVNVPSGQWMLRILALCPDEETRANFFVDIAEAGSKIPFISRPQVPKEEKEASPAGGARPDVKVLSRYYKPRSKR